MESTLRLFKAVPIERNKLASTHNRVNASVKDTATKGFVLAPEVIANYPDTNRIIELVNATYGRDAVQLNQSFHKSWHKVQTASMEQLVLEQIIHYFTTYGAESMGLYSSDSVYIPRENLDAPELEDGIRLVVIHGFTKAEFRDKLIQLLSAGVALSDKTIADVLDVAQFIDLPEEDIELVKNKEVKAALYDYFGIVPGNPIEFLRFVVYRATEKTLLIKNAALVAELKEYNKLDTARYFDLYEKEFGYARLAEIFYRYKPIFLALRTNTKMKRSINKIRRLAVVNHKPMKEDVLNNITAQLKKGELMRNDAFKKALDNANVFRKIRLAYALKFRTTDADSIVYRVRNGKSYAKEFSFDRKVEAAVVFDQVMDAISTDVRKNVEGKKIFIPEGLKYALPATEKMFTGNLPSGTYVELSEDMVAGVHWENQGNHRIDLDLSISNVSGKIGWDASYRNDERSILFSGDMTDAPKPDGASELFYVGKEARGVYIMSCNYYNYDSDVPVPFKILVAHQKPVNPKTHYTVDPNAIVALSNAEMETKQKNLGIIVAGEDNHKFYFAETNLGGGRSARVNDHSEQARKFLLNFYTDSIVLNDVLVNAGAKLVTDLSEADIDLSPEAIDKGTILDLLSQKG